MIPNVHPHDIHNSYLCIVLSSSSSMKSQHIGMGHCLPPLIFGLFKPTPASFSFIFGLFKQISLQFLQLINVKKYPSSIQCWDSNPRPSEHGPPPIPTRPGIPTYNIWPLCTYF